MKQRVFSLRAEHILQPLGKEIFSENKLKFSDRLDSLVIDCGVPLVAYLLNTVQMWVEVVVVVVVVFGKTAHLCIKSKSA